MYNEFDEEEINNLRDGLYRLTNEYKKIFNSKEYQMGKRVLTYKELLKQRRFGDIIKRLRRKTAEYNSIINGATYCKPNAEKYRTNYKIAVYTSIFGSYDHLMEPVIKPENIDYFIITDQKLETGSLWKTIDYREVIPPDICSNTERNRYVKMLPHKIFNQYDYSIYIDGNIFITSDLTALISTLDVFPVAMHRHKNRDCVYEEITACIQKKKDDINKLKMHKELLLKNGVPEHYGLLEATVISRKHNDSRCIELMEKWWSEFYQYSRRDQISLIDNLWLLGMRVDDVATLGNNIMENNHFVIIPHL